MKKAKVLLAVLLMTALMVSCSKEATNDDNANLKGAAVVIGPSTPKSGNGIVPEIIAGVNTGGNRTCAEVAEAWDLDPNPFLCGDKLNYGDYDFDGDYEFDGAFPDGLNVTVEGNFVSFNMDGCIQIEGKYYQVGAVIVKGSNSANVYYYADGTLEDSRLAAPGGNRMVSNLTFCFIECDEEPLVIAVKSFLTGPDGYTWAGSDGSFIFLPTTEWCQYLGVVYYPATSTFAILEDFTRANLGTVTVEEAYPGGVRSLIITVTSTSGLLDKTYLYVGDLSGIYGTGSCPDYTSWPNQDLTDAQIHTFTVPF